MNTSVAPVSSSFIKISQHITCTLFLAYKDFQLREKKSFSWANFQADKYSLMQGWKKGL